MTLVTNNMMLRYTQADYGVFGTHPAETGRSRHRKGMFVSRENILQTAVHKRVEHTTIIISIW